MDPHAVLSLACFYAGITPDKFFDDPTERCQSQRPLAARVAAIIIFQRHLGWSRREIAKFLGLSFGTVAAHLMASSIGKADRALSGGLNDCIQAIVSDDDIDDPDYIDDWQPHIAG